MKKSIFFAVFFVFLSINSYSQKDFTFCYGSIAVTIYDGGNAEMVRYNSSGSIVSKVTGKFDLYGKGSSTEVLKIQFQGNEYRYDLIRDGRGVPSLILDNQSRKYTLCKTEVRDQAQDDAKFLNEMYAKWREEERLLKIKYASLAPDIKKVIGNPIRISYFEVANNDVADGQISDAILDLKNGWRIPSVIELSLIYSKFKNSLKGPVYITSDIDPDNTYYERRPGFEYSFDNNYKVVFPRNRGKEYSTNEEPYVYSSNPGWGYTIRFVRDIAGPIKTYSKKWDWYLSEPKGEKLNVYGKNKVSSNFVKDYPYFPLSCGILANNSNDVIDFENDKVKYKIKFSVDTDLAEHQKKEINENMIQYLDINGLPTLSEANYDHRDPNNKNNLVARYDKRMFIATQMILKGIKKIELFNSDSSLCSSVINFDEIEKTASTMVHSDTQGNQLVKRPRYWYADVVDKKNASLLWIDKYPDRPFLKYDIIFSAPLKRNNLSFKNFEKHRLFYFRFTTVDGIVIFSDKFLFPYGLAMGGDYRGDRRIDYRISRLFLNQKK
jgi:hypothetical protein